MGNLKQINEDIAIAYDQPSFEQFKQFAATGFKSVLNLRAAGEAGSLSNESQQARDAGLYYANVLVEAKNLSDATMDKVLKMANMLPKPILCHCKSGFCAGFVALAYDAQKHCLSAQEALSRGSAAGFNYEDRPQVKRFIQEYINKRYQRKA